jgi:hypothetical protein
LLLFGELNLTGNYYNNYLTKSVENATAATPDSQTFRKAIPLRVLAVSLRVLAVEATNSLENFSRIQLIYNYPYDSQKQVSRLTP